MLLISQFRAKGGQVLDLLSSCLYFPGDWEKALDKGMLDLWSQAVFIPGQMSIYEYSQNENIRINISI